MIWAGVVLVGVVGLFLSAFFSGAETGLYRVNRLRLHLGVQRREPYALRLAGVLEDETGALSVMLVGTNLANYLTTLTVAYAFAELLDVSEARTELYTVALVTPIIFVFGETVPKNLFRLHADTLLRRGSRLLAISHRLLCITGVVWSLTKLAEGINRIAGLSDADGGGFGSKRRVTLMLQEALAGGTHSEDQSELIDRVCRLSETPLHRVMVPRNRVKIVAADTDRRGLLRAVRRLGHSRLPVFETDRRRIVGIVKVDELLQSDDWSTVGGRMQPPVTFTPHETVASAVSHLQRAGRTVAVVTDRGGHMLGIITLKDLIREVIGDIADGV